jgi:hypothetical protein
VSSLTSVLTITTRPRDGKNITATQLFSALTGVYKVSYPFAIVLALGGIAQGGHGLSLDLEGLCVHNKLEHDASLVSFGHHASAGSKLTQSIGS